MSKQMHQAVRLAWCAPILYSGNSKSFVYAMSVDLYLHSPMIDSWTTANRVSSQWFLILRRGAEPKVSVLNLAQVKSLAGHHVGCSGSIARCSSRASRQAGKEGHSAAPKRRMIFLTFRWQCFEFDVLIWHCVFDARTDGVVVPSGICASADPASLESIRHSSPLVAIPRESRHM